MNESEWDHCSDWARLLTVVGSGILPQRPNPRKLRLWTIACCRRVLVVASADPSFFSNYHSHDSRVNDYWDMPDRPPAPVEGWHGQMEFAERFADGMPKERLARHRVKLGGPWSLFHLPLSDSRMKADEVVRTLRGFVGEYPVPTATEMAGFTRDIFGNPFRPVVFDPRWRTESAVALARTAYEARDFALLPILADALEEAGCDHPDILIHCRDPQQFHVRGCWVVDGVLGKT